MPLQTGQVLNNRYRIVKLLGQGGFGAVYRAWDVNFQLPCALKENSEVSSSAQRQFLREARILHTLRHPNLPFVKDYFLIDKQGQYLVMDFIEGLITGQGALIGTIHSLARCSNNTFPQERHVRHNVPDLQNETQPVPHALLDVSVD